MIPAEDCESLALLYHLNSEPRRTEESETDGMDVPQFKEVLGDESPFRLPRSQGNSHLMQLIQSRRSCRSFREGTMPVGELAELLRAGYGLNEQPGAFCPMGFPRRSVPSAGARYPLEIYVATGRVDDVVSGLHHYNPRDHSLEFVHGGRVLDELAGLLLGQQFVRDVCAVMLLAAVFPRTLSRYGARGYRFILFEAGHVAQNVCLLATELGLGTVCLGGYFDSQLNRFLGLDGVSEASLYCVAIGYPGQ